MVRIRLRRIGGKGQPSYRLVAADKESPRDGRFLEILGFYNPRTHPATIQLKEDRLYDWMNKGAQPSDSVEQVLKSAGFFERYERLKNGEAVEALLEEASAAEAARNTNLKTSATSPASKG
jgi:small subunit ribosomal protein S16